MMRTIVAILALAPAALFAQTAAPAQPSSAPVLQSMVRQPASLAAVKTSLDRTSVASTPVKVSTGVIAPKILHTVAVDQYHATLTKFPGQDSVVVVSMMVDTTGKPTNLKVVKSQNPFMDERVLEALSQFRFQPGTLDGQEIALPVTIEYTIK